MEEGDLPAGDFILKSIPEGIPEPAEFVKDSHHIINHVMQGVKSYFGVYNPHVVREWEEWINDCPRTDDVNQYVQDIPLHIPLRNILFAPHTAANVTPLLNSVSDINVATYRTQPVVKMGSKRRRVSDVPIMQCDNGIVNDDVPATHGNMY